MSIRKIVKIILPLILFFLLLKPLCLTGIGLYAKFYLQSQLGLVFRYESVSWKRKGICFSNVQILHPGGSSLLIKKAVASLSSKHIDIKNAHLDLAEIDWNASSPSGPWTISIQNGTFAGLGIEPGRFVFEKTSLADGGTVSFFWNRGTGRLSAFQNQNELQVEGEFSRVSLSYLKKWIGDCWGGDVSGKFSVRSEKGEWIGQQIHLEGNGVSHHGVFDQLNFLIDWSGPLDWKRMGLGAGSRGEFQGARFITSRSLIKGCQGSWNFDKEIGGKWECSGLLGEILLSIEGRTIKKSLHFPWSEALVRYGESTAILGFSEEASKRNWSIAGSNVSSELLSLIQDIGSVWNPSLADGEIRAGTFEGSGRAIECGGKVESWMIDKLSICQAEILHPRWLGRIKHGGIRENYLCFEGVDVDIDRGSLNRFSLAGWKGEGHLDQNLWKASGSIQGIETTVNIEGTFNHFSGEGVVTGGYLGTIPFSGSWRQEALSINFTDAHFDGISFEAWAFIRSDLKFTLSVARFEGQLDPLCKMISSIPHFSGNIKSSGSGYQAAGDLRNPEWSLEAKISQGTLSLASIAQLSQIEAEVVAGPDGISFYQGKGIVEAGNKIPFSCPIFQTNGRFDFRLQGKTRDYLRLEGNNKDGEWFLDLKKSHLLGNSFEAGKSIWSSNAIEEFLVVFDLPWSSIASFKSIPPQFEAIEGNSKIRLSYLPHEGASLDIQANLSQNGRSIPLQGKIRQKGSVWHLESSVWDDCNLQGEFSWEKSRLELNKGAISWKDTFSADVNGEWDLLGKGECTISRLFIDLAILKKLPFAFWASKEPIEGKVEGQGYVHWNERVEGDFDCSFNGLKMGALAIKNLTPVQIYYASDQGVSLQGLDFQVMNPLIKQMEVGNQSEIEMPWIQCKMGLVQFDPASSLWTLKRAHFHLPADFQTIWKNKVPYFSDLSFDQPLDFIADIEIPSDFSTISAFVKEGFFPWQKEMRHIQNLHLSWDSNLFTARFDLFHQSHLLKLGILAELSPEIEGKFFLGEGSEEMVFSWTFADQLKIQSIEGGFGGLSASFHFEGESLIGSAHLDFSILSDLIPEKIAQVFTELSMGKGYELMGRLRIEPAGLYFRGILSGKQLELFGYQMRTLLARVEIDPDRVRIYDLKISDSAGIMKIDEIVAAGKGDDPWTLSIPHLNIFELRPSLLQKNGQGPGEISPLVIRQLNIDGLKGLLSDEKTWEAEGELTFINSYKRERTVFDIPSDVLSRIVGLDFDLLIPVCGTLKYQLKNGAFNLTQLEDSFSENHRSEFFLVEEGGAPTVDLDGNIKILIKMKQFVLFKFTESFVISIDGKLNNPQFHLQKKRRFAELLGL